MKTVKIFFPILLVASLLLGCQSREERLDTCLKKSIHWLWQQQGQDGGWHSQTHAVLKDGKALTPYILYHLLLIPEPSYTKPAGALERGVDFIRREIRASMSMSKESLPLLNYPNYSAAYALKVLCLLDRDTALQRIIVDHLLREQLIEHRGITPDNLAYGGWGYGEPDLPFGEHGHVDISHTRRIVESLVEAGYIEAETKAEEKTEAKAKDEDEVKITRTQHSPLLRSYTLTVSRSVLLFLQGVQRSREDSRLYEGCNSRKDLPYDGGFISSLATLPTNKSEPAFIDHAGYHYPSYATATCDGLLALYALGMAESQAYKDAVNWLTEHQNMNTIDGLSSSDPEQWYQVMHYYHLAVRAEAMNAADIKGNWITDITRILIQEQTPEGYYINPIGGVNKEDDPLMATIFAVQAGLKVRS